MSNEKLRLDEPIITRKRRIIPERKATAKPLRKADYDAAGVTWVSTPSSINNYRFLDEEGKKKYVEHGNKTIMLRLSKSSRAKRKHFIASNVRRDVKLGYTMVCSYCKEEKGKSAFYKRKDKTRNMHISKMSYCMDCRKIKSHEYYLKNKEKWRHINDAK